MKLNIFYILFCISLSPLFAQEGKLFDVEYDVKGQTVNTLAFTMAKCSQISIHNAWVNWVKARNGKLTLLNKNEANEVRFKNSPENYKTTLNLVDEGTDSLTIITTLVDEKGMFVNASSVDYPEIYERLKDLSFEMRKGCYRHELTQANEYMIRLSNQNLDLHKQKGKVMKSLLKNQNELLKLETQKNSVTEKLSTIESDLMQASDDKKIDKLMRQKQKVESNFYGLDSKIGRLNESIKEGNIQLEQIEQTLSGVTEVYQSQSNLIENLRRKLNEIYR
ncbi:MULTISPECIES: hypothetical protein [Weeksella]|uniref:Uncharacterized protein n=1 Tax=Weeksella virosa (strain ATCC 43766 / DSM 16922 / JCM 21250 / CCUG 30538 / CDC 9751 / IAM 14551 / NBRC 16016 / NCTC 11634 / CL345/78) TaxID=865938 RepID=F0NY23_WEEVC|nr:MULTISPECIES: hypothetical protein [Weeksella]ADX67014.1 hypothetical protein Weevi_0292 [Weeksella virosa DSM 16922]MDK7375557.1 hypothetical protein [Weeksella virosa]OFM84203.1 hypothetical protein HMPREF2660_09320 [Weeksella sp. HMSC059D05]SUP53280.1 Uncharacterised protein [Weeksella virosa]VEH63256.1 Uncharacterised protein [Weeksella virosa]